VTAPIDWADWLTIAPRPAGGRPLPISPLEGGPPMLPDRVVLVTGGSSGLGRSLVDLCLDEGARVATLARRPVEGVPPDAAPRLAATTGDLSVPGVAEAWVEDVLARWGRIDALINNAAIADGDPVDGVPADLTRVLAVNVVAAAELIRLVVEPMRRVGRGRIINVTSDLSVVPAPAGLAGYAASKAALNSVTSTLAALLRSHGILVNALFPGHFRSRLDPTATASPRIAWPMTLSLLTCGDDGPSGRFFSDRGELAWFR